MVYISVIGLGYLGATQAIILAKLGHKVVGVDTDKAKVSSLNSGQLPFFEPGLGELLVVARLAHCFWRLERLHAAAPREPRHATSLYLL